jgi:hypothetical protein
MISGLKEENLMGLPTVRNVPRSFCSTSTMVPLLRMSGSSASSFMLSTGAHGTSHLRRMSTASYLVLSASHFSISSKISKMCDWRARGVLYSGSSTHSGRPMASAVRFQFCSWIVK